MKKCASCEKPLEGRQRRFCSNLCKMAVKNADRAQRLQDAPETIRKLEAKVKRLQNQVKKLKAQL